MSEGVYEQISKKYGLGVMGCVLDELSKIPGLERLIVIKHAYEFILNECENETVALLLNAQNKAEYIKLKDKLDTILPKKMAQIVNILEIENISALLDEC